VNGPCELTVCERASPEDVEALVELDRGAYQRPWSAEQFLATLHDARRDELLLVTYGRGATGVERHIVAHCALQLVAGELEIHNLAVRAGRRREGWGRRLLRLVLASARRRGAQVALLEVRESNLPARRLYAAEGFEELFRRRAYYQEPREDALVLRRELAPQRRDGTLNDGPGAC
jgi:ribosomal-protein-alanine N-acetyltransferase